MKTFHTSTLFYGKYPYRVRFSRQASYGEYGYQKGWTLYNCKEWLFNNSIDHKIYGTFRYKGRSKQPDTIVKATASVFVKTKTSFDQLVSRWPDYVESVTEPYSSDHVDLLKNNLSIILRKKLIYNKYRYSVIFYHDHWNESLSSLKEWIDANLNERLSSNDVKFVDTSWNPRLYLNNDDDLVLTKLTWADKIKDIQVVRLYDE
jgi:hypothetical protein